MRETTARICPQEESREAGSAQTIRTTHAMGAFGENSRSERLRD